MEVDNIVANFQTTKVFDKMITQQQTMIGHDAEYFSSNGGG